MEYIIVGDTDNFDNCLIMPCGSSRERAEENLQRILKNPTENDKKLIKGHKNLRISTAEDSECWWNRNCD